MPSHPTTAADSARPVSKVAAAGAGGAAATALVTIANALGLDLPPEVAAATVAIAAFVGGYLMPDVRP